MASGRRGDRRALIGIKNERRDVAPLRR